MTRRTGRNPWLYPPKDSKQGMMRRRKAARISKTGKELVPIGPTVPLRLGIDKNNITKAKENIAKELNIPEDSIPFTLLIHYSTTKYLDEAIKQLTLLDQNKHTQPQTSQRTKAADYEKIKKACEETNIDKTSIIKAMIALTSQQDIQQANQAPQPTHPNQHQDKPNEIHETNTMLAIRTPLHNEEIILQRNKIEHLIQELTNAIKHQSVHQVKIRITKDKITIIPHIAPAEIELYPL